MVKIKYKCCWCKCEIYQAPKRFDYVTYITGSRGYEINSHYDFCDSCYQKINVFMLENDIRPRRVKKKRGHASITLNTVNTCEGP